MEAMRDVVVMERGVAPTDTGEALRIRQKGSENARQFAGRVGSTLAELQARGIGVGRASLQLSTTRGPSSTERRFSLARAILSQLPEAAELRLEGPLGRSEQGRLDIDALVETLRLFDSRATVSGPRLTAREIESSPFWPRAA